MDEKPATASERPAIREILTDALRYWEWRRLFYNLALGAVVLFDFGRSLPWSQEDLQFNVQFRVVLVLFLLAVLANIAYCAAYLVEVLVQFSDFREAWRRSRFGLWLLGTAFALVLTHFFSERMFRNPFLV